MQNFVTFWESFLGLVADFLMSEPIIWFTAVFLLLLIVGLLQRLFNISR